MTRRTFTRREILQWSGTAALGAMLLPRLDAQRTEASAGSAGAVVGEPIAAKVGERILRDGGNAIDAAIASAFAAAICSPSKCGMGGYGGHAAIAIDGGRKVTAIDFNTIAPAAARADMYPLDGRGRVVGNVNNTGWLAAGVPGTLAGLELALVRYGTRSLREVLAPAITMCEEGVYVAAVKGIDDASRNDPRPEAAQDPSLPREKRRNRALAGLLKTLAARDSTDSFYRGDIGARIADAFRRHGGLVTREDMAAYRAREVAPLTMAWNGCTVHTVPLTATGLLVLEALAVLKALDWSRLGEPERLHAKVEALRVAWADRLRTFGDPAQVKVPVEELLSPNHVGALADKVRDAMAAGRPVPLDVDPSRAGGTINISAADRHGNLVAITLTHGGTYGAKVAVDEYGLILGHGMSRFDPRPGLPNSPGPRKQPITNMCPSIVTRAGGPALAIGGAGGTRIPGSIYEVLVNYVGVGAPVEAAMNSPRIDTNGTLAVGMEKNHSAGAEAQLKAIGFTVTRSASAYISAAAFDPATRMARAMSRGGAY